MKKKPQPGSLLIPRNEEHARKVFDHASTKALTTFHLSHHTTDFDNPEELPLTLTEVLERLPFSHFAIEEPFTLLNVQKEHFYKTTVHGSEVAVFAMHDKCLHVRDADFISNAGQQHSQSVLSI
jgi:hypothetical protein